MLKLCAFLVLALHAVSAATFDSGNGQAEHTPDQIAGDWRCVYIDDRGGMACETCESEPYRQLRIIGDSAYEFSYPFQYYGKWAINRYTLRNDTLIIGKCFYTRDRYDDNVIASLVRDSINRDSLIGNWMLITKYRNDQGDEDGDGFYHVEFPFKVPKTLTLNRTTIYASKNPRKLLIPVDGTKKAFYVEELWYGTVTLVTGSWRKEPFVLEYTLHKDVPH